MCVYLEISPIINCFEFFLWILPREKNPMQINIFPQTKNCNRYSFVGRFRNMYLRDLNINYVEINPLNRENKIRWIRKKAFLLQLKNSMKYFQYSEWKIGSSTSFKNLFRLTHKTANDWNEMRSLQRRRQ